MMYKVPLTNSPNQTFQCTIPVNQTNIDFNFNIWYNEKAKYWCLSLSNYKTGEVYFSNLPLLSSRKSYSNVINQLSYIGIGMLIMLPVSEDEKSMADDTDLGTKYIMIWGDNE